MMEGLLQFILVVAIVVLGFYVLMKVLKSILKAVSFMILILFLVSIIFGVIVYLDFKDLKENFPKEKSLVALENDKEVLMLAEVIPNQVEKGENPFKEIENNTIRKKIMEDNFQTEGYYKTIIFKEKLLKEGLPETMELPIKQGRNITREEYLKILSSEEPVEQFAGILTDNEEEKDIIVDELEDSEEIKNLKGMVLSYGLKKIIEEKGPVYMIKKFKQKQVQFHPETISSRLFRLAPTSLVQFANKKALNNTAVNQTS